MTKIQLAWSRIKFVVLFTSGWAALKFFEVVLGVYTTIPAWWISPVCVISVGIYIKIQLEKISDFEKTLAKVPSLRKL